MKQKNKRLNLWAIAGCIVGALAIIMGIVILGGETESARDGGGMKFGADFYTEMHGITRDVFISTLRIHEVINSGFGWILITFGLFGVCYFAQKVFTNEKFFYEEIKIEENKDSQSDRSLVDGSNDL